MAKHTQTICVFDHFVGLAIKGLTNYLNNSEKIPDFWCNNKIPLVLMFVADKKNNMINKLHERALMIELNDRISDFEAQLRKSNDISSHHRNRGHTYIT